MADAKISALNENTTPASGDLLPIVDDPGGTPETQKITYGNLTDHTPKTHASSHQNGGGDEISVAGLSGELADNQPPKTHASSHERAGSDQIDGDHLDIDWNPSNYTPATTPSEAANADDLTAHLYGIDQALGSASGGANEFFAPATCVSGGGTIEPFGNWPAARLGTTDEVAYIAFVVPDNFSSITEAVVVVIADYTEASANFDIYVSYGTHNQDKDTHTDSDTTSTYSVNDEQIEEIDISGLLGSLAAGDYVAVKFVSKESFDDTWVLGVRFKYS